MNNVKISVVMPAYNAEQYISEAIESILRQTFKDFEYIVIDDGSTDNTVAVLNSFKDKRLKVIRNEKNLNQSKCRNIGIREAEGEYCAFMDADDVSFQDRLQKQFDFLEGNPEVGIVGGTMEIMSADNKIIGKRRYPLTDAQIRKRIFWFSPFCFPSIMVRKSILEKNWRL
jgi:Glycosyltransferases involved in cell wall biogenesis